MKLTGKNVVVTGAAKGMGRAITLQLASEGADIVMAARDVNALEELASEVRDLGHAATAIQTDVTHEDEVKAMAEEVHRRCDGRVDILVNVAGVTGPIETPAWEIEDSDFMYVLDVNVRGTFLPIKHIIPMMIEKRQGKIVNIGGTSGMRGYRYRVAYSASKWSVRGLTRTVALDAGEFGINVNAVCPGIVHTPRMEKLCREKARVRGWTYEQVYQEYLDEMALKRVTMPEDIANAVLFLASDDSRNVTGQELVVDGGWDV